MTRPRGLGVFSGNTFGADQAIDPSEAQGLVNPLDCPAGEEFDMNSSQCVTKGQAVLSVTPPPVPPAPPLPPVPPIPAPGPPPPSPRPGGSGSIVADAFPYVAGAVAVVGLIAVISSLTSQD